MNEVPFFLKAGNSYFSNETSDLTLQDVLHHRNPSGLGFTDKRSSEVMSPVHLQASSVLTHWRRVAGLKFSPPVS